MSAVSGGEQQQQGLAAGGIKPPLAVPRPLLRMRSDAALAERFAAGDEAAFDVIYERHRPVVLAVCMGVLGTPPDAEDATQETFSALAVALRTRPPAELRPWLIRVARNASIDTTRRRRHRLLTLDGEIPEIAARPQGSGQAELAVVLDGIRELPEGQRMALLMRELGGHSYSEIAEFLATDEEAVKGLIARARVGLRTYREATELSCTSARSTIAEEPDGRRYDKTIRRHLRGCAACRGYREALRDDAKALRAALPIQAGTVATGGLSGTGMLSAAKGSLISYGLTQAATTCAASACAVGAIGGMVFVAPVHKLGLDPILPARTAAPHHRKAATKLHVKHHAAAPASHTVVAATHPATTSYVPAKSASKPAIKHRAVVHHHRRHVTFVALPTLPKHHTHRPAAGNQNTPASLNPGATQNATQPATNSTAPSSQGGQGQGSSQGQGSQGQGNGQNGGSWGQGNQWNSQSGNGSPATSPTSQTSSSQSNQGYGSQAAQTGSSQTAQTGSSQTSSQGGSSSQSGYSNGNGQGSRWGGNGHGSRWGGNGQGSNGGGNGQGSNGGGNGQGSSWGGGGHYGKPVHTTVTSATSTTPATTPATTTTATSSTPTSTATTPTTTTTTAQGTSGWGHGWGGGSHHGGNWHQGTSQSSSSTPTSGTATSTTSAAPPTTSTSSTSVTGSSYNGSGDTHGGGHGHGGWGQQGGSNSQNGGSSQGPWGH
jgi:RNA polymerase sigma factor (sigma-70 family)